MVLVKVNTIKKTASVFEDENYFGIRKAKRKTQKIELNKEFIKSIRLKKAVSNISTVSVIGIPIAIIISGDSQK